MRRNALYYPHISMRDSSLIKYMSLYYDSVYRIVPDGVFPEDNADLRPLIESGAVGAHINPEPYAGDASGAFLEKLKSWGAAALEADPKSVRKISKIHEEKTDERVRRLFSDAGFKSDDQWLYVPTELASNYILFLAKEIAEKNDLALATADWGAWTGNNYMQLDGQVDGFITTIGKHVYTDEFSEGFGLFGIILNEICPVNIAEIPAYLICEFREKRKDEISELRKCMDDLREEISCVESSQIRVDMILEKAKNLSDSASRLKKSADVLKAKGWFGVQLLGIPAPVLLGNMLGIPEASTMALAVGGLAIGGLYTIASTPEEVEKIKAKKPESFFVDFRRSFRNYTSARGGGDINFHAYNCMEEYVND